MILYEPMRWAVGALVVLAVLSSEATSQTRGNEVVEGFSAPARSAKVAAATSAILKQWLVQEGQVVTKGQPLAILDDAVHQSLLDIAKAAAKSQGEIKIAEAEQRLAQMRLEAIGALSTKGHATPDELLRARAESEVSAARLVAARERLEQRRLEMQKLAIQAELFVVTAPFGGVVKHVNKQPGEYVGPIDPEVCELADLTSLSASFFLTDSFSDDLATGDRVQVKFPSVGQTAHGIVTLSPYPDAETGMRSVKVRIENPGNKIEAGLRCLLIVNPQTSE